MVPWIHFFEPKDRNKVFPPKDNLVSVGQA